MIYNSVDVVVGGQAGSEGKGAITAYLSRKRDYEGAIRCSGSNAGHSVYDNTGEKKIFQVLPVPGLVDPDVELYIGAEAFFTIDEIKREVEYLENIWNEDQTTRIHVDPKSAIIEERHKEIEKKRKLGDDIGSTTHGIGAARTEKIWRSSGDITLAEDCSELENIVTKERVYDRVQDHNSLLLEGTQGTLLSLNQSDYYPKTTSQDCIASSFLSSAGLPPSAVRNVWCVFRTYPIRVAGNSGVMNGEEVSFEKIKERAGFDETPIEYTSVTGRKRRIFEWSNKDFEIAKKLNNPDRFALTFVDYLNKDDTGVRSYTKLSEKSRQFISTIEKENNIHIDLIKTGEKPNHIIDRDRTVIE